MITVRAVVGAGGLGILIATLAGSCGDVNRAAPPAGPTFPDPPPATEAVVTLTLSPSPVSAVVAAEGSAWDAEWTVTIRETAGIGGDVDSLRATLTDGNGATIAATELGPEELSEQLDGSNHIFGRSTQSVSMTMNFDFPEDVGAGDLLVTVDVTDDRGNDISAAIGDVIQICVPELLTPSAGAALDNGCTVAENGILWEFEWEECPGAELYHILVQQRGSEEPMLDNPNLTAPSFTVLGDGRIQEESRFGWFWRVRAHLNGVWSEWSEEREFEVEPLNTDCVTPLRPF